MAEKSVTLKHLVVRHGKQAVHFYDGALTAEDGLLTLPSDRPEWVMRAWRSGYVLNPANDQRLASWAEVEELMSSEDSPKRTRKSAKSTEETGEDSNTGGQSKAQDRLRSSEQEGGESVPDGRARSEGSGSADNGKAKATKQSTSVPVNLAAAGGRPASKSDGGEDL